MGLALPGSGIFLTQAPHYHALLLTSPLYLSEVGCFHSRGLLLLRSAFHRDSQIPRRRKPKRAAPKSAILWVSSARTARVPCMLHLARLSCGLQQDFGAASLAYQHHPTLSYGQVLLHACVSLRRSPTAQLLPNVPAKPLQSVTPVGAESMLASCRRRAGRKPEAENEQRLVDY